MSRTLGLILASAIAAITLTGCASTGTGASGQPSGNVTMFTGSPSAAAAQPSSQPPPTPTAEASSGPCTTRACIVDDAKQLKGKVAKDNAVMTKVTCKQSTVRQVTPGTYTVHCTITYSDGMVARGIASVLTSGNGEVDWEPTQIVSYGSGG